MLNSGTNDHFMSVHVNIENIIPTTRPLNFVIPDGNRMEHTHECDIMWPTLPKEATTGHIIPQLTQKSLLSIVKLFDAGCSVIFKHNSYIITYNNKIIIYGLKCPRTRLWLVPLNIQKWTHRTDQALKHISNEINNVQATSSQQELVTYLNQFFSRLHHQH